MSGQFSVQRVKLSEFAGQKLGGEAVFLGPAPGCEGIGKALAFVGAVAVLNLNKPGLLRLPQEGVEPPERKPHGLRRGPLRGVGHKIKLPQKAEEIILCVWAKGRQGGDSLFVHA